MRAEDSTTAPVAVLIAGGGAVGSTLALALARVGVPVALVDAAAGAGADRRPIALSASSVRIFRTLGVWPAIAPHACPIGTVHVSEKGRFPVVRLHAREQGVGALGHVTEARVIGEALDEALAATAGVQRLGGTRVVDAVVGADRVRAVSDQPAPHLPDARLLVVAEGGASPLLRSLGIACRQHDYDQAAVVCRVTPGLAHDGVAYERFTASGPLALLPLAGGDCGLVWTLPEGDARYIAAAADDAFLAALQEAFGHRLGRFRAVSPRGSFPLALVRSESITGARFALAGNAANRLHPVAGQGLNLGLRDAALLADLVARAVRDGDDPGAPALLEQYARGRRPDQRAVARFTDALARGFTVTAGPAGVLRSIAMLALDLAPPLGGALARRAMGLAGQQSRLVRGVLP